MAALFATESGIYRCFGYGRDWVIATGLRDGRRRLHRQTLFAQVADGQCAGFTAAAGPAGYDVAVGTVCAGRVVLRLRSAVGEHGRQSGAADDHLVRPAPRVLGPHRTGADPPALAAGVVSRLRQFSAPRLEGDLPAKSSQYGTLRPTTRYCRQNRVAQGNLLSVPSPYRAVLRHGNGVTDGGLTWDHADLPHE